MFCLLQYTDSETTDWNNLLRSVPLPLPLFIIIIVIINHKKW